jgi:hypothetical protein
MQLKNRLDAHFASAAAVAMGVAIFGASHSADAGIVWSGIVNINIPSTTDGVYLNVITGQSGSSGVAGWHVNPRGDMGLTFFAAAGGGFVTGQGSSMSLIDNLGFGTMIDGTQLYSSGAADVESSGSTTMNLNSSKNLLGFRFINADTGLTHYGWMRIQFTGTDFSQPRAIFEYAYESTAGQGIQAGYIVPSPGAVALVGAAGLLARRRRR